MVVLAAPEAATEAGVRAGRRGARGRRGAVGVAVVVRAVEEGRRDAASGRTVPRTPQPRVRSTRRNHRRIHPLKSRARAHCVHPTRIARAPQRVALHVAAIPFIRLRPAHHLPTRSGDESQVEDEPSELRLRDPHVCETRTAQTPTVGLGICLTFSLKIN